MTDTNDSPSIGETELRDAARSKDYGSPRVVESEILSPGTAGSVFNPVVWAEFRRWRARPVAYLGIVLLVSLGIVYYHKAHDDFMAMLGTTRLGTGQLSPFMSYLDSLLTLIARPSTLLPLLMVWRALVSFRGDGFYRPFRTTFISPSGFLWGVVAVPVLLSAVILVAYTSWVLTPSLFQSYYARPEMMRYAHPYFHIMAILYEGGLNGALVAMVALYFGVRGRGRLLALLPVVYVILMIQGAHAWLFVNGHIPARMIDRFPLVWSLLVSEWAQALNWPEVYILKISTVPEAIIRPARSLWPYVLGGTPKLLLCFPLWYLTRKHIESRED